MARPIMGSMGARMADVMMQLGSFQFSVATAAYQELSRSVEYRWSGLDRIGDRQALQFTGYGSETIELRGVIYPFYRGGLGQLDAMREQAEAGSPLSMVSGRGAIMGLWVVVAIREGQRVFERAGVPKRQEFDMSLRRYDGGLRDLLPI